MTLASTTLLASLTVILLVAAYAVVPWMGKLTALYFLHGFRDRLYSLGTGGFKTTLVYQDMEFFACALIVAVREHDKRAIIAMIGGAMSRKVPDGQSWRLAAYDDCKHEFSRQRDDAFGLFLPMLGAGLLFLVLDRPVLYLLVPVLAPVLLALVLGGALLGGLKGPGRTLAGVVEANAGAVSGFGPLSLAS